MANHALADARSELDAGARALGLSLDAAQLAAAARIGTYCPWAPCDGCGGCAAPSLMCGATPLSLSCFFLFCATSLLIGKFLEKLSISCSLMLPNSGAAVCPSLEGSVPNLQR